MSIRNNGQNGVSVTGGSATALAQVTIEHSRIEGNAGAGVLAADFSDVTVDGSSATGNGQGLACVTQAAGNCKLNLAGDTTSQNGTGVLSGRGLVAATGTATVYLTDNEIVGNAKGVSVTTAPSHGALISFGDNTLIDNTIAGKMTATATKL